MLKKLSDIEKKNLLNILLVSLSSLIPLSSIIYPQLFNDELLTFNIGVNLLNNIYNLEFIEFIIEIIKDWHPPARNILATLFIFFFGENISAIRIPYYILWIFSCILTVKIVDNYSKDHFIKFLVIIFIAGSGLFHIQIMGIGHGLVTFLGLYIIFRLLKILKKKQAIIPIREFNLIAFFCFIGFLFFNTFILITINFYLLQLFLIIRNKHLFFSNFLISSLIFGSLHILYLLIFIGLPFQVTNNPEFINQLIKIFGDLDFGNWDYKPFGQYHQYLARGTSASIGFGSIIENISYLNWYFFPFIPIIIIPLSLFYLFKTHKYIFFTFINYFLFTNFFMSGNTHNHFVSMFIWLIPFFCLSIKDVAKNLTLRILMIIFCITLVLFTTFLHLYPYKQSNYPFHLADKFKGTIIWPHNIINSLNLVSDEIKSYNLINFKIGYINDKEDISLVNYYFKDYAIEQINSIDLKILSDKDLCEDYNMDFRVIISLNSMSKPCKKIVEKVKIFEDSTTVYLLK